MFLENIHRLKARWNDKIISLLQILNKNPGHFYWRVTHYRCQPPSGM